MKLIKCQIENFGALSGFKTDFADGLCVIKEDNGFGKTTLAAFVKAMFYGLPATRKADINENERVKFDPWQGGNYGGTLDFECEKGTYRIERFFGLKARDDTFKLFNLKTGTESADFSENIGEELFFIDAESFKKSIFLPQQSLSLGMNASINAKLTGLVEDNDDIGNFDTAMAELDKQQKARGVKGRLDVVEKEIATINREINDKKSAAEVLDTLIRRREQYKSEEKQLSERLEVLRKEISAVSDLAAALKDNERRLELIEEIEKCKTAIENTTKKYKQLPTESDVLNIVSVAAQYNSAQSGFKMLSEDDFDEQRLENIEEFFVNGVPDDEQIALCREHLRQLDTANIKAEAKSNELNAVVTEEPKKGKTVITAVLVAALLLSVVGIALLFVTPILGAALLGVGVISAGVAGFLLLKGMILSQNAGTRADPEKVRSEYETLCAQVQNLRTSVLEFTQKYSNAEPQVAIDIITENLREYRTLKSACDRKNERKQAEEQRLNGIHATLSVFFDCHLGLIPQNINAALDEMREDLKVLRTSTEKQSLCEQKLSTIPETEIPQNAEKIDREVLIKEEAEAGEKLDGLRRELTSLQSRITAAELAADALQEFSALLDEKNEQREELASALQVVQLTVRFLQEARDGLSGRYMTVLKDGFAEYSSKICGDTVGEFMLDNSLDLGLNREGGIRQRECFSEGYRDMLDICMRLALADALYDSEKPMLILDDPFVNLDDERLHNALALLEKLAQDRQIIYLTCHKSRVPQKVG